MSSENSTEPKTAREWYSHLKEPYKSKAIKNSGWKIDYKFISISDAINDCFIWADTIEWAEYWRDIHNNPDAYKNYWRNSFII